MDLWEESLIYGKEGCRALASGIRVRAWPGGRAEGSHRGSCRLKEIPARSTQARALLPVPGPSLPGVLTAGEPEVARAEPARCQAQAFSQGPGPTPRSCQGLRRPAERQLQRLRIQV